MAIARSQLLKELEPGLNALFGLEYDRYDNEHAEIYDTESSDRAFEEEVMLSGFGTAPEKAEGAGFGSQNGSTGKSIGELSVASAGATTAGDNFRVVGIKSDFEDIDVTSAGVILLVKLNVLFHLTATGI